MAHYLVCYDIADPRRLGRVHRRIIKHAMFIQLSVYYLQGDRQALEALLNDLQDVIDEGYDDVRAYAVRPLSDALQIGCPWLPEGIGLFE
ncbi:MAG: CRISPR-associated endonuclease Cas2 [Pseudohongiellaceae bacterium]